MHPTSGQSVSNASQLRPRLACQRIVAIALSLVALVTTSATAEERTIIHVRPTATPTGRALRLADVAEITAHDADVVSRMEALDLTVAASPASIIGRRFIDLRLQLAGFDESTYELRGATQVTLPATPKQLPSAPPADALLEELARRELSRAWSVAECELQVSQSAPVIRSLESIVQDWDATRFELQPRGTATIGAVPLQLRVLEGERLVAVRLVPFAVARRTRVVVATTGLPAGTTLDNSGTAPRRAIPDRTLRRVSD